MSEVLIVGAGLSGATVAHRLAEAGIKVKIIDERPHVAGNCHTEPDPATGIRVHVHGPHIFHTDHRLVWELVNRFACFKPYRHRVKAISRGRVYSLPLNLMTINQVFNSAYNPEEARGLIDSLRAKAISEPANFEEQALAFVGQKIYDIFFRGYTQKQWGCDPKDLPAEIIKRLPIRFNYDDTYFTSRHQGLPADGYTRMVENMLAHPAIEVEVGRAYQPDMKSAYEHVFYSGPLDRYFDYREGRLPYRTLKFKWFTFSGDYQGCPVMNYVDQEAPHTRVVEHKHLSYWEPRANTICNSETPEECGPGDIPYYPVRFAGHNDLLDKYLILAEEEQNLTFIGRLGTFRYLDMDAAISEAWGAAGQYLKIRNSHPNIERCF